LPTYTRCGRFVLVKTVGTHYISTVIRAKRSSYLFYLNSYNRVITDNIPPDDIRSPCPLETVRRLFLPVPTSDFNETRSVLISKSGHNLRSGRHPAIRIYNFTGFVPISSGTIFILRPPARGAQPRLPLLPCRCAVPSNQ